MSSYSAGLLSLGPVAYWQLAEPAGPLMLDERFTNGGTYPATITHGLSGPLTGDPTTATGFPGGAVGASLPATTPGFPSGASARSYVFAVKTAVASNQVILVYGTVGAGAHLIDLSLATPGLANFEGAASTFLTTQNLQDGAWHFVVATYDGTKWITYVDNVAPVTSPNQPLNTTVPGAFGPTIGSDGGAGINGSLAQIAIFSRVLSAGEVAYLYGLATAPPGVDFDAIAEAIAARFIPAAVSAPSGYTNIRSSTADLPNQMPPLPCVLVFPDSGDFEYLPQKRDAVHRFTVRFYFSQVLDLTRDMNALRLWLTVLVNQLKGATQLGGTVTLATIDTWSIGTLRYAGQDYTGIELGVRVVTNEGWAAVA